MADRTSKTLVEQLACDAQQGMLDYGKARAYGDNDAIRGSETRAWDALVDIATKYEEALKKANALAEHFGRELRGYQLEAAEQKLAEAQDNPPKVAIAWMYETTRYAAWFKRFSDR